MSKEENITVIINGHSKIWHDRDKAIHAYELLWARTQMGEPRYNTYYSILKALYRGDNICRG